MSGGVPGEPTPSAWSLWRRNGVVWLALLVLLLTSFGAAYLPLGAFNTAVGLLIAVIKAGLVAVLFMELGHSGALMRLAGGAGLLFVFVMFALTLADFLTRLTGG
jgi:cytochrome c oxidase subunit 4